MGDRWKAKRYRVHYYIDRAGCVSDESIVWAYTAADARYQMELSMEGVQPKDPYFRVTKIEPVDRVELKLKR